MNMQTRTVFLTALCGAALFAGCATDEPKPAAKPEAAPAPAVTPRASGAPAPVPGVKKPAVVNLSATQLFAFDKATLTPEARGVLDSEVIAKLKNLGEIRFINVNGHADRIGTPQYNQRLSDRRAGSVRAYLVSRGVDASRIETFGFGKTQPVKSCPGEKKTPALIECLQPNRRVVVEFQGTPR
jgi:OOP family OmpA-OmpF porin